MVKLIHSGWCIICGKKIYSRKKEDFYIDSLSHMIREHFDLKPEAKEMLRKRNKQKGLEE